MECETLETRLGPLAYRSSGQGPTLVFFAGALANGDLWRDVVATLEDRYRCITVDLPLGAHPWPLLSGADRSATSLARLQLDCLELLDVPDATVVANDTAGALLLLSLATGHPARPAGGRRSRCRLGWGAPAAPHRRGQGDPRVRPAGPGDLGRGVQVLPHRIRPAPRIRFPQCHSGDRSRCRDVGPGRQPGRGGRRDREVRADARAVIAKERSPRSPLRSSTSPALTISGVWRRRLSPRNPSAPAASRITLAVISAASNPCK